MGIPHALVQHIYRSIKKEKVKADVMHILRNFSIGLIMVKMDKEKGMVSSGMQ